jgi:glutamate decarboxylase
MHSLKKHSDSHPDFLNVAHAQRQFLAPVPKYALGEEGMAAEVAYQLVHDELMFDAQPQLNLATFITSWMEPQAEKLFTETLPKNLIDREEYPQTSEIERRVVSIVGHMLHAPHTEDATGTTTVGSSEAIMLAFLAHKRRWQLRRGVRDKSQPNLVFGADAHTCIEKFCRYFDVEPRMIALHPERFVTTAQDMLAQVDDNTIAVCGIAGTTYTGQMDDLQGINAMLLQLQQERGLHVPLHIDAASGGFTLPFSDPTVLFDFRLSQVRSINVSNHKFGLVYPGLGTLVFRDKADLPEDLIFHINYLGGDMPNYSLNFSRSSGQVIAQYYSMLRLGRAGHTKVIGNVMACAKHLAEQLRQTGRFELVGDGTLFPVVVARAADPARTNVFLVSQKLREHGWVVPAYTLPANAEKTSVLRFVVRESMSRDLVDRLLRDIFTALQATDTVPAEAVPAAGPHNTRASRAPLC